MVAQKPIPGFKDQIHRYQDEGGLWRRLFPDCYQKGELKSNWKPKDDEVHDNEIGNYYIANNGKKVYISYKQNKK